VVHWFVQLLVHCPPEHGWDTGQATAASQSVQPDAMTLHVCTPVPEHCFAPAVHWLTQPPAHLPAVQVPLRQSAPPPHFLPAPHCWQEPPQSTSVSVPSSTLSTQDSGRQTASTQRAPD
jgi:hypothetical protein